MLHQVLHFIDFVRIMELLVSDSRYLCAHVKKALVYIWLLLFMNNALLLPPGSVAIVYSSAPIESADFCSVSKWIYSAVGEHNKKVPNPGNEQEDGKSVQNNIDDDYCHRMFQRAELITHPIILHNSGFPEYTENNFTSPPANIAAPPPEFS